MLDLWDYEGLIVTPLNWMHEKFIKGRLLLRWWCLLFSHARSWHYNGCRQLAEKHWHCTVCNGVKCDD